MIVQREHAWVFDTDICTTLRRFIERAGVISLQSLAQYTGRTAAEIEYLLANGTFNAQIEWLRPLAAPSSLDTVGTVFCRWRTPEDLKFVWEQDYFEGRRPAARRGSRALHIKKRTHEDE